MFCIRWRIRGSGSEEFPLGNFPHSPPRTVRWVACFPQPRSRPRSWWHICHKPRFFCKRRRDRKRGTEMLTRRRISGRTGGGPEEDRSRTVTDRELGFSGEYSLLVIRVRFVVQSLYLVDFQRVIVFVQSRLHLHVMPLMLPHHF